MKKQLIYRLKKKTLTNDFGNVLDNVSEVNNKLILHFN